MQALKKEKSESAKQRAEQLQKDIEEKKKEEKEMEAKWQEQKTLVEKVSELQGKIDEARARLEKAEREVNLDKAAEIKYGELPRLEKELKESQDEWLKIPVEDRVLRLEVSEEDVALVVSRWTGIPVTRLIKSEQERLIDLENEMSKRVVGQDEAVSAVARAVRRSRAGIADENRPIASFLFLGPTGVGKTETAKALAAALFNDESAMVRIDMSEYMEQHSVARLIGAPPGYIGYDEGGQLTEAVRRRPYSVVLFDEIEKAHDQVYNVLLQVFDEGRLTDGKGRTVDFRNTVLVMTSNLASEEIARMNEDYDKEMEEKVWAKVQSHFRPEFINRLDQMIIFEPLSEKDMEKVVTIQLKRLEGRLEQQEIEIEYGESLVAFLARKGYDRNFGARPLKRLIQSQIEDELAMNLLEDKIMPGSKVRIEVVGDGVEIKVG